ncbi:MAG TPA: lipopolysaccharide biosynthesis protein [Pirellulales bacterium]|jgi:O-antigen/teichoic acid export membrane protein|nr:lipopolysaccharide biosynthesis protein [Pirellulales bacterium]
MALEPSNVEANSTPGALATGFAGASSINDILSVPTRGLRANATWILVGNTVLAGARQLIFVLIAKLGNPEMLGQYGWAVAFCVPTVTICSFGIRSLLATDARREVKFSEYLGFTLVFSVIGLLIVAGMILINRADGYTVTLVMLVTIWTSLESISDTFAGLFTRDERMDLLAKACIFQAVLICVFLTAGLAIGKDLRWGVLGLIGAAFLRLVGYEWPNASKHFKVSGLEPAHDTGLIGSPIFPQFHWKAYRHLLSAGIWLAILLYLLTLCDAIPRYLIKDQLGDAAVGVFTALFSVSLVVNLLVISICQSMSSRLAVLFATNQRTAFLRLCVRSIIVSVSVGLLALAGSYFVGKPVLAIVFTPKYTEEMGLFYILLLTTIINCVSNITGTAITSMRRFAIVVPVYLIRIAIVYFGGLWAIQRAGLQGIGWILVAASAFQSLCHALIIFNALPSGHPAPRPFDACSDDLATISPRSSR